MATGVIVAESASLTSSFQERFSDFYYFAMNMNSMKYSRIVFIMFVFHLQEDDIILKHQCCCMPCCFHFEVGTEKEVNIPKINSVQIYIYTVALIYFVGKI